ncbi:MAG: NAD(P)-dependent oxidoreductase [Cyclobacteriaceae bacterium]
MKGKVLIIDDVHTSLCDGLVDLGYQVDYLPTIKATEVLDIISGYKGLILRSKLAVDEKFLLRADSLAFIGRGGAGLDQLDMEAISGRNITVVNAPEGNRDALGEHMTGMLLSLLHNIPKANNEIRAQKWDREGNRGIELGSLTVGLIGYGMMGSAFASKLAGFGCQVLAYDKYKSDFGSGHVQEVGLEHLFEQADVLSLHVPLTDETNGWIDGAFIDKFRKPIYLLNSARGKVAVLSDLADRLEKGKVIGACLDVLENEKFAKFTAEERHTFERLSQLDNVIFTPHVAGWTVESYKRISTVLLDKIRQM